MGPKSGWGVVVWLSQTSPIPRSPDGDNKVIHNFSRNDLKEATNDEVSLFSADAKGLS